MKLRISPVHNRWKPVGLWLLLAVMAPAPMFAAGEPTDPETLRQQAVSQYIDGATKEVEAYRQQVCAAARPDNQAQLKEANARLDECIRLVADLKSADQAHFDLVKADYERSRSELVKALQAAQKN